MKDCRYYQQLISSRLDEALEPAELADLKRHLHSCHACREFESAVRHQHAALASLPRLSAKHLTPPTASPIRRLWRARISIPAPLAAAIVIAIGSWILWPRPEARQPTTLADRFEQATEIIRLEPAALQPVQQDSEEGDI